MIELQTACNDRLHDLLKLCHEEPLREAMSYSVYAGGKRLRPMLLLASCEAACGGYDSIALDFACAMEMIQTYSLIHDDLPAMDDDDFRRGQPTCHKVFGEAMAILAGDALLNYAYEVMSAACLRAQNKRPLRALQVIAQNAGINGMVAGQAADMRWENKTIDESTLLDIHKRKTGALIKACLGAGALLGGGTKHYVKEIFCIGAELGCAFQIQDDILDVTGTQEILGKPVHSDEKNNKNTYVTVFGFDKAMADYQAVSERVLARLIRLPQKTDRLWQLVQQIISRVN